MGRKVEAAARLSVGKLGPQLTQCRLGPRPTSVQSGILIHPTVWPQYTNVTDRQTTRTTSHSTGRTVLQTVAKKLYNNVLT